MTTDSANHLLSIDSRVAFKNTVGPQNLLRPRAGAHQAHWLKRAWPQT